MRMPNHDEQKDLVKRMIQGHQEVDRMRLETLRGKPYDPVEVDTLLQLADYYDGPPRLTSGLVEMQRIFMKGHAKLKSRDM